MAPLWRLLRRNLISDVLNPSRAKLLAPSRKWVLRVLIYNIQEHVKFSDGVVVPVESFEYAMFYLLVLMCFGEKPDEILIRDIKVVQRFLLLTYTEFNVFGFFPSITKLLFYKRWNGIVAARRKQEGIILSDENMAIEDATQERAQLSQCRPLITGEEPIVE